MESKMPDSVVVLVHLVGCLVDGNAASLKALKQQFVEMDPRAQQIYVTNLKKMLMEHPLFSMRVNEKGYFQIMTALNEVLKESVYNARKNT